MIDRRDALRLLSLSAVALAAAPALAACGTTSPAPPASGGDLDLVSSDVARVPGDPAAVAPTVAALHRLGGGVLGAVGADQTGNLAVSPYSIGVALALTLNGAQGRTLEQLLALYAPDDVDALNTGLDALTADLESLAGPVRKGDGTKTAVDLASANALFGQRGERWQQPFLDTLARSYGAGVRVVDYEHDAAAATTTINAWTAQQTHDKITDIIPPGILDASTRLVLVNALYLKAPWESPFEPSATADGDFTRPDGSTVRVPMMQTGSEGGPSAYVAGDGWAAVTLPYAGKTIAMTVLVPDAGRFAHVQAVVVAGGLPRYLAALRPGAGSVQLTLPRWTFRTQASLSPALRSLGVTDALDPTAADFSAMTEQERLYVSAVLHQVYVAVDEQGTEAAAATAVVMGETSAQLPRARLVVDRPFLFVIHDVTHRTPLFLGRVTDPTAR